MTHTWRYEGGESPGFDDQQSAEDWLSENWRDLADQGVDQVTLHSGDEVVYGPMSLHAP